MAAKGWWVGCGVLVLVAVLVIAVGVFYVAGRVREFGQGLDQARERYGSLQHDFPFNPPADGVVDPDLFARYMKARRAVQEKLAPAGAKHGLFEGVAFLSSLPDEISRVHATALREVSMSLDSYRWVSRQIYTAIAEEGSRPGGDPRLAKLRDQLAERLRKNEGRGFRFEMSESRESLFGTPLLDLSWLRVPEATRALVAERQEEIAATADVALVDMFLLSLDLGESKSKSRSPAK